MCAGRFGRFEVRASLHAYVKAINHTQANNIRLDLEWDALTLAQARGLTYNERGQLMYQPGLLIAGNSHNLGNPWQDKDKTSAEFAQEENHV